MFQEDTLDLDRIDMELGWAENIGFNILRIYLRYLLWRDDLEGFKRRLNQVLNICNKHGMKVLLVLFDDCWDQDPQPGKQPDPTPGVHNAK